MRFGESHTVHCNELVFLDVLWWIWYVLYVPVILMKHVQANSPEKKKKNPTKTNN